MCSCFEINAKATDIVDAFGLEDLPPLLNNPEVRPTDLALVIGNDHSSRLMKWGLEVRWSKTPLINARSETLTSKATFQPLLENRCLIPATAYYEWRKEGDKRLKNKISVNGSPLFCFAGLIDSNTNRVTMITTTAEPSIAHIHPRMPVILSPEQAHNWTQPETPFAQCAKWLRPYSFNPLIAQEEIPPPAVQGDLFF